MNSKQSIKKKKEEEEAIIEKLNSASNISKEEIPAFLSSITKDRTVIDRIMRRVDEREGTS